LGAKQKEKCLIRQFKRSLFKWNRIANTMPETPQEIRDLREATARSAVDRLKTLALECRQLSTRSAQTYETLAENPELQTLEAQLHEAKKHVDVLQVQLKYVTPVKRMKRFTEKHIAQQ
jgi:hypothetical protein